MRKLILTLIPLLIVLVFGSTGSEGQTYGSPGEPPPKEEPSPKPVPEPPKRPPIIKELKPLIVPPKPHIPPVVEQPRLLAVPPTPYIPREVLVALRMPKDKLSPTVQNLARDYQLSEEGILDLPSLGVTVIRFKIPDARDVVDVISLLEMDNRILFVQPNYIFRSMAEGRTPQYGPQKVRADVAWSIATGKGVKVALIDTGVDDLHRALKGKVVEKTDVTGDEKGFTPGIHGTALAGVIAAGGEMKGIAPDARILAIQAFHPDPKRPGVGLGSSFTVARALDFAIQSRAQVINASFGAPKDKLIPLLVDQAIRRGIVFVAAAGNDGPQGRPVYPAALEGVIAVTATDHEDRLFERASRGSYIALAAPGVEIFSPVPGNGWDFFSGTSMAAAHVAGVVALLLEKNPNLTPHEVKTLLESTALDLGEPRKDPEYGAGRVDAFKALETLVGLAASRP